MTTRDPLSFRIADIAQDEAMSVSCLCGRTVHYLPGFLQRSRRIPSETLIAGLAGRLRCTHCGSKVGITISIIKTGWHAAGQEPLPLVIVKGSDSPPAQ